MMKISFAHPNRLQLETTRPKRMTKDDSDKQQPLAIAASTHSIPGLLASSLSFLYDHTPTSTQLKHAAGYLAAGTLAALHSYPSTIFEEAQIRQENQNPRVNMAIASGAYALGIAVADYCARRLIDCLRSKIDGLELDEHRTAGTDNISSHPRQTPWPVNQIQTIDQGIASIRNMGCWDNHTGDMVPNIYCDLFGSTILIRDSSADTFLPSESAFVSADQNKRLVLLRTTIPDMHYQPVMTRTNKQQRMEYTLETSKDGDCFYEAVLMAKNNNGHPISKKDVQELRNSLASHLEKNKKDYQGFFQVQCSNTSEVGCLYTNQSFIFWMV